MDRLASRKNCEPLGTERRKHSPERQAAGTLSLGRGVLQRSLSRRHVLQAAGISGSGLAISSLAACSSRGKQTSPSGPGGQQQAKRGGVVTRAGGMAGSYDTQGRTFDPDIQTQFGAKGYTLFYERLLAYNIHSYAVEPELAQKWEQPSQTEYIFHLQPNVKWQNKPPVNGRPLTSEDIRWSFERARTDDPKFFSRSLLLGVDKIEAPDGATIRITTKAPDVSTVQKLSVDNLAILAREVIEKYPKPTTAESAVGTGPFVMTSVEQGVGAEYARNPGYWKPGLPYLDGFRTKHFADPLAAFAAFTAGQIDVGPVPGSEAKKYIDQQGAGFSPYWYPDDTLVVFQCPNTKKKPMDDARVTRALRLLTDHTEFIKAWAELYQGRGTFGSIFPTALSTWDLSEQEYGDSLEWKQPKDDAVKEAMSLLTAAGYSKTNPVKFTLDSQSTGAVSAGAPLLQAQWKRLGQGLVDVDIKLSDTPTLDGIRASRSFTYGVFGFSAGLVEPGIWLSTTYRSNGSLNFAGFGDPQVDAMIDKQQTLFNEQERKAAVKQIIQYMIDHAPTSIGANDFSLNGAQSKVHGFTAEGYLNGRQYQNVWLSA